MRACICRIQAEGDDNLAILERSAFSLYTNDIRALFQEWKAEDLTRSTILT
jgi:hypothetical protein